MRIASVISAYAPNATNATPAGERKGRVQALKDTSRLGDRVEISQESLSRFQKAQGRVATGYYNSEKVTEDISDKLTRVLDEMAG